MEMFPIDINKEHGKAIKFQSKMEKEIKAGNARDYVDAGLLVELSENAKGDKDEFENALERMGNAVSAAWPLKEIITRRPLLRETAEKMQTGNKPILLRGIWRTGNTSVMRNLEQEMNMEKSSLRAALNMFDGTVSLMEYLDSGKCGDFALKAVQLLAAKSKKRTDVIEKNINKSGLSVLEYLDQALSQLKKPEKVLLELDEATALTQFPDAMNELNEFAKFQNIMVVVNMHRIGNQEATIQDKLSDFEQVSVPPLTFDETRKVVKLLLPKKYTSLTDDELKGIHLATGGRPMEISEVCQNIEKANEKPLEDIISNYDGSNYVKDLCFSRVLKFALSDQERDLVKFILAHNGASVKDVQGLGDELVKIGVLKKEKIDDTETYMINGTALEKYFRKELGA